MGVPAVLLHGERALGSVCTPNTGRARGGLVDVELTTGSHFSGDLLLRLSGWPMSDESFIVGAWN